MSRYTNRVVLFVYLIVIAALSLQSCSSDSGNNANKNKPSTEASKTTGKPETGKTTTSSNKPEAKTTNGKNPVAIIKTSMGNIHVELFADEAPNTVKNFVELAEGKKEFKDIKTGKMTKRPFYDGLIFHRVIANFMVQGGCPRGNGTGGPGYQFADEINARKLGLDKIKMIKNGQPHPWLGIRSMIQYQRTVLIPLYKKLGIKSQQDFEKRKSELQELIKTMTLMDVYVNMGYQYNETRNSHAPKRGALAMANSGPNTNGSQFFINVIDTPWLTGKHTVFGKVIKGMDIVDKISKVSVGAGSKPATAIKIISIRLKK